ncbi:18006_t:CDS:1, partial [Funneliformis geosporum]
MEVEATSTSSPQDKGKGPEQIIPPIKNTPIDLDQSFDSAENMLNNTQQKNTLHFERKTGAPIFFAFCAADTFLPKNTNKGKCNAACDMFNGPRFPSFTGAT